MWRLITPEDCPAEKELVDTKIDDGKGERNIAKMFWLKTPLWFFKGGDLYAYYNPTHWRPLPVREPEYSI